MPTARTARQTRAAPADGPKVSYLVGRLDRALRRRLGESLAPFRLSVAQYSTLAVLQRRGESSNAELASRALISPQAMNEVVQQLELRKLVKRRADPLHGRIVRLFLTPNGVATLTQADSAVGELEHAMLGKLTPRAQQAFSSALRDCIEALENTDFEPGSEP